MEITRLKKAQELDSKRSYNAKHFLIGFNDKTPVKRMDAHAGHIHYFDKLDSNRFREIDWTLNWDEIKKGWGFKYHNFRPFLPEYSNDWIEFRDLYQGKDQTIRYKAVCDRVKGRLLTAQETKEITKQVELNSVIYDNAFGEGIDLILYFTRSALKKVVIIKGEHKEIKDYSFDFEVEFPDGKKVHRGKSNKDIQYELDLTKDKEFDTNKQLLIGNDKKDGKEWFTYIRGFLAWDSEKTKTIKVDYFIQDGKKFLRKKIDKKFIEKSIGDVFTDTTTPYYAGAGDGYMERGIAESWDSCRETTSAVGVNYTATSGWGATAASNPFIYRASFPFDTSGLPDGAIISDADLFFFVHSVIWNQDTTNLVLTQHTRASNTTLAVGDYDIATKFGDELASRIALADLSTAAYTEWALTDFTTISDTSFTNLAILIGRDYDDSAPTGANGIEIRWSEYANTASDPYLSVTYTEVVDKAVSDSGAGSDNILVSKGILLSEAGTGTENILVSKELILIAEAGVGAEIVTAAISKSKAISDSGVGSDDVDVSKKPDFIEKHILIKVYDSNGNYLKTWDDATFEGFTKELNGGIGECQIKLGRKFDNYGEYFDVALNNEVQILITDRDTRDSDDNCILIYSGYISKYTPWIEGGKEGVIVHCLGYYTKLANDIYKNGTTTSIQETATDVGTIFRNLMIRYVAETTNPKLHYSLASILTTSTTATYIFEMMTYREAIEVIKSLAPTDWWWYVDQYHQVKFKNKPTATNHTFIFGRHFQSVKVEKSMEKIKNALLFWNREIDDNKIYKLYTDSVSIADHDRRVIKYIDQNRVGSTTDADKIGQAFVAEHKEPDIKVIVEIIDNAENSYLGYDIESIEPGHTCIFSGFSEALSETFRENMLITKVEYTLEKVRLTIEPTVAGIVDRLEHIAKQVSASNTKNAPTQYST